VATSLLNCQSTTVGEQPTYEIREISQRKINKAHDINEVIKKPFDELLEFRRSTKGPTDDVPLPHDMAFYEDPIDEVKRTEMATEQFSDPYPRTLGQVLTLANVPRSPTDGLPGFCYQDILNARLLAAVGAPSSGDGEENSPRHLCY
jgi:hypothetical protein